MDIRLARALELLALNPAKRLRLPALAKQVGLSVRMMELLFKTHKGQGFARYYRELRVALAKDFLTTTDDPVKEIASKLGYRAVEVFCRDFKRECRCTPLEYRARSRKILLRKKSIDSD